MGQYHPQFVEDGLFKFSAPQKLRTIGLGFNRRVIVNDWYTSKALHQQIKDWGK